MNERVFDISKGKVFVDSFKSVWLFIYFVDLLFCFSFIFLLITKIEIHMLFQIWNVKDVITFFILQTI